jgi:thiosulfate dehydrogenase
MEGTTMIRRVAAALALLCALAGADEKAPKHKVPKAQHGGTVVGLCDGDTATEVPVSPGTTLPRTEAQKVSDELMAEWQRKHPEARWEVAQALPPPPPSTALPAAQQQPKPTTSTKAPAAEQPKEQTGVYEAFNARDELVWTEETKKFVAEGNAIFHDAKKLGGTIGISCDMCHPNAANTHPETYPKYQVQLQRVALLRDMINWCIENPVKGKALPDDSRTMRALEAYIIAQRKGQKLDYGRH